MFSISNVNTEQDMQISLLLFRHLYILSTSSLVSLPLSLLAPLSLPWWAWGHVQHLVETLVWLLFIRHGKARKQLTVQRPNKMWRNPSPLWQQRDVWLNYWQWRNLKTCDGIVFFKKIIHLYRLDLRDDSFRSCTNSNY